MAFGLIIFSIVSIGISICYYWLKNRFEYWTKRGVPHDKPIFLLGNMKDVGRKYHISDKFQQIYNKYKGDPNCPFAGFYFFTNPAIIVLNSELSKNVLITDFVKFCDRGIFCNESVDPLTGHLFSLDGPKWKSLRTKLSPTFTSVKMKLMFTTMVDVGQQLDDVLMSMVKNDSIIEIKEILSRFATDVIGSCAFGIDCNSLLNPNAEFRRMGKKAINERRNSRLVEMFIRTCPKLAKFLRIKRIHDDVTEFFLRIVRETVEYREKNGVERNDFMNFLIEMKNNKTTINQESIDSKSDKLTIEQIAAQAFIFFLAGFETSSSTMAFGLFELALNQNIQNKLRSEIVNILNKYNGNFTYEAMSEMKYLEKIINETLRKYPVIPNLIRRAHTDYMVPNTNKIIEKGILTIIPVSAIHNDPDIYPNPEMFDPNRFTSDEINKRNPSDYSPFGDGPRNCIGLRFGKMQISIALVKLIQRFKFSVCSKTEIPIKFQSQGLLLASKGGIYLNVEIIDNIINDNPMT